jgi:NTP pyrophosphatase (non-canonical NTP hydrolase)
MPSDYHASNYDEHGVRHEPSVVPSAAAVSAHIARRWPVPHLDQELLGVLLAAAKVAAEAGELVDAVIKTIEDRAGRAEIEAEFGDVLVASRCLAGRLRVDPDRILADRWAEVVKR